MLHRVFALIVAALIITPAAGHQFELGALVIRHPWSRATADGMPMGVAYLSITNNGKVADALLAASSPVAGRVEIHQTSIADGVARMRPLSKVEIAPGATVKIEPGGIHLMLVDLEAPLIPGKVVPLTLDFRVAGSITVELQVEARDASGPSALQGRRKNQTAAQSGILWPRVSSTHFMKNNPTSGTNPIMTWVL